MRISHIRELRLCLFVVFVGYTSLAFPHSGGLDKDGGHVDRKTGLYHCHREPCFTIHGNTASDIDGDSAGAPFVTLYDREDWPHWIDEDRDCQDTRAEVLIRDSLVSVEFQGGNSCGVNTGLWQDLYTGRQYRQASDLDIDHVVPLKWAHGHGGDRWTKQQKQKFANDTENLLPVGASINREKGSKGPDDWLPPAKDFQCEYLRRFVHLVQSYQLHFVDVEVNRLTGFFNLCGIQVGDS